MELCTLSEASTCKTLVSHECEFQCILSNKLSYLSSQKTSKLKMTKVLCFERSLMNLPLSWRSSSSGRRSTTKHSCPNTTQSLPTSSRKQITCRANNSWCMQLLTQENLIKNTRSVKSQGSFDSKGPACFRVIASHQPKCSALLFATSSRRILTARNLNATSLASNLENRIKQI